MGAKKYMATGKHPFRLIHGAVNSREDVDIQKIDCWAVDYHVCLFPLTEVVLTPASILTLIIC